MQSLLSYFGLYEIILVVLTCVIISFLRWFLDPYFKHNSRKKAPQLEFYANGQKLTKSDLPFLLRQIGENKDEMQLSKKDLCGLGLVVPCYNEEKRVPIMLDEHIKYI